MADKHEEMEELVELLADAVADKLADRCAEAAADDDDDDCCCCDCCDDPDDECGCSCHEDCDCCCDDEDEDDLFDGMDVEEFQNLSHPVPPPDPENIATYIDHTLLKANATHDELVKLCDEARKYGTATVCVNSTNVDEAAALLQGSHTVPIAVVGFPLGAALPEVKAFEARQAVRNGAREIDTVINVGALKDKDYQLVFDDIQEVVDAVAPVPVKVIIETCLLDHDQKVIACALSKAAGAAFVKTSTGFSTGGATAEDIALMRGIVGPDMGVKASGGVRTLADARKMIDAGASRIGCSASVAIVEAAQAEKGAKGEKKSGKKCK